MSMLRVLLVTVALLPGTALAGRFRPDMFAGTEAGLAHKAQEQFLSRVRHAAERERVHSERSILPLVAQRQRMHSLLWYQRSHAKGTIRKRLGEDQRALRGRAYSPTVDRTWKRTGDLSRGIRRPLRVFTSARPAGGELRALWLAGRP